MSAPQAPGSKDTDLCVRGAEGQSLTEGSLWRQLQQWPGFSGVLSLHMLRDCGREPAHLGLKKVKPGGLVRSGLAAEAGDEDFVALIDRGSGLWHYPNSAECCWRTPLELGLKCGVGGEGT